MSRNPYKPFEISFLMPYTLRDIVELILMLAVIFAIAIAVVLSLTNSQPQLAQVTGAGMTLFGWIYSIEYIQNKVARREGYISYKNKVAEKNKLHLRDKAKKAGFKDQKKYFEYAQNRRTWAFHSFLMAFGAFFLSLAVAITLENMYLFWVVFAGCITLIFLRSRILAK